MFHFGTDEAQLRRVGSPGRKELNGFSLRSATKLASESWATQCRSIENDVSRCQAEVGVLKRMSATFAEDKQVLCTDLKQLLMTVREAQTICRVVDAMEARAPVYVTERREPSETHIDVSVSPKVEVTSRRQGSTASELNHQYQRMLRSVLPSNAEGSAPHAVSPQPRMPHHSAPLDAATDADEDDLVVLLLKRQLQRRELELKQLMQHQ
jgi:hypothetical protein